MLKTFSLISDIDKANQKAQYSKKGITVLLPHAPIKLPFIFSFLVKKRVNYGFLCPATKSGGVLCYTLRTFECLSVGLSVRPSVCPSPLMGTYWVGYLLSTCSLFRIGVHRTTQLILTYCWVFCLLLGRNFVWEKPNKNTTV